MSNPVDPGSASVFVPKIGIFERVDLPPRRAVYADDEDAMWHQLLAGGSNLQILPEKEDKKLAPAFCGCHFVEGASSKHESNATDTHFLVLDVDHWQGKTPYTKAEICQRIPFRHQGFTTWQSTKAGLRYRVMISLKEPMPVAKHRSLVAVVNRDLLGGAIDVPQVDNPARLGFFGAVKSEAHVADYEYWISDGPRLSWRELDAAGELIEQQAPAAPVLRGPIQPRPGWIPSTIALETATESCLAQVQEMEKKDPERPRHLMLLQLGCQLIHAWAFSDSEVLQVFRAVNENFRKGPHPEEGNDGLVDMIDQAHERVEAQIQHGEFGNKRDPDKRATRAVIKLVAAKRKTGRPKKGSRPTTVYALEAIGNGECFTTVDDDANANLILDDVCWELVKEFADNPATEIFGSMKASLGAQRARAGTAVTLPSDEEILRRLQAGLLRIHEKKREDLEQEKNHQREQYRHAFSMAGIDRDTPYTAAEIKTMCDTGFDEHHWIVQHSNGYYFRVGDRYLYCDKDAAANFAWTLLSPAEQFLVREDRKGRFFGDKDGKPKKRPLAELVEDYGVSVKQVVHRAGVNNRVEGQELVLRAYAAAPKLAPVYSPEVEKWLQLLAGDKFGLLNNWLRRVPLLHLASTALVFVTRTGAGKNMFATGLSRLFGRNGPILAEDFFKHNPEKDKVEDNPVMLFDEHLPVTWKTGFSAKLRALTAQAVHSFWSGRVKASYAVFLRFILTANNAATLFASQEMQGSRGDDEAFATRVLFIKTSGDAAAAYVKGLGLERINQFLDYEIAQHVLWLCATSPVDQSRFGVEDISGDAREALLTNNQPQREVMDWVYTFIIRGEHTSPAVVYDGERIYTQTTLMSKHWVMYAVGRKDPPSETALGRSLAAMMAPGEKTPVRLAVGTKQGRESAKYRCLDTERFLAWAMTHADADVLEDRLNALKKAHPIQSED